MTVYTVIELRDTQIDELFTFTDIEKAQAKHTELILANYKTLDDYYADEYCEGCELYVVHLEESELITIN